MIKATGGIVTDVGGYVIHKFESNGTLVVSAVDSGALIEILSVAGGGGGALGGGGAGGVRHEAGVPAGVGVITVTIGLGGARLVNGGNSSVSDSGGSFADIVSYGGGYGSNYWDGVGNGGSGGGGYYNCPGGTGIDGQGSRGGGSGWGIGGAGGGGAGGVGSDGTGAGTGLGGPGVLYTTSGMPVYYGGGGSGFGSTGKSLGGGGAVGENGTDFTGGGGGSEASGAKGVVYFRYKFTGRRALQNEDLAVMEEATIKGRPSGAGTGTPSDLTAADLAAILGVTAGGTVYSTVDLVGAIDCVNVVFNTPTDFLPGSTRVTINGLEQKRGSSYTETSVNEITFSEAPSNVGFDDVLRVTYISA
jgi:hypothetical protein